jgi:NAD(P)-dependent dehydrogenase (short-subunit alcohol dehydrogenase family)
MSGKTVLITGANSGIGKESTLDIAKRGARIIMACRNMEEGEKVAAEVKEETGNTDIKVKALDLASLASVRKFAEEVKESEKRLDVLLNNAGTCMTRLLLFLPLSSVVKVSRLGLRVMLSDINVQYIDQK